MRLIDGDRLAETTFKNDISCNAFKSLVQRQPTVATICRDCQCWYEGLSDNDGYCVRFTSNMSGSDFCSRGEKRQITVGNGR